MDAVRIHSLGADAPAALDADSSWGTLGGWLCQPVDGQECRKRNALPSQFKDRDRGVHGGQSDRSDIDGAKMRKDLILVVIGQSAGTVVTQADNRRNRRPGLRELGLVMRALAYGRSRARAKRQGKRDTE